MVVFCNFPCHTHYMTFHYTVVMCVTHEMMNFLITSLYSIFIPACNNECGELYCLVISYKIKIIFVIKNQQISLD